MSEKGKPIMNRNEIITPPFTFGGNRIINESPGHWPQRWIEE